MASRSMGLRARLQLDKRGYDKALAESGKKTAELGKKGEDANRKVQAGVAGMAGALGGLSNRIGGVAGSFTRMFSGVVSGSAGAAAALGGVAVAIASVAAATKISFKSLNAYADQQHMERLVTSQLRSLGGSFESRNTEVKAMMNALSDASGYDEVPVLEAMRAARGTGVGSFGEVGDLSGLALRMSEVAGDKEGGTSAQIVTSISAVAQAWDKTFQQAADWITRLEELTGQNASALQKPIAKAATGGGLGFGQEFAGGLLAASFQSGMVPRSAASAAEYLMTELTKPNSVIAQHFRDELGKPIGEATGEEQLQVLKDIALNTDLGALNLTTTIAPLWRTLRNLDVGIAGQFSTAATSGAEEARYGDIMTDSASKALRSWKETLGDIWEEIGAAVAPQLTTMLGKIQDKVKDWISSGGFEKLANQLGNVTEKFMEMAVTALPKVLSAVTSVANVAMTIYDAGGNKVLGAINTASNWFRSGVRVLQNVGYDIGDTLQGEFGQWNSWKDEHRAVLGVRQQLTDYFRTGGDASWLGKTFQDEGIIDEMLKLDTQVKPSIGRVDKGFMGTFARMIDTERERDLIANALQRMGWEKADIQELINLGGFPDEAVDNLRLIAQLIEAMNNRPVIGEHEVTLFANRLSAAIATREAKSPAYVAPIPQQGGWETAAAAARLGSGRLTDWLAGQSPTATHLGTAKGLRAWAEQQFQADGLNDAERLMLERMDRSIVRLGELVEETSRGADAAEETADALTATQSLALYSMPILTTDDLLTGG